MGVLESIVLSLAMLSSAQPRAVVEELVSRVLGAGVEIIDTRAAEMGLQVAVVSAEDGKPFLVYADTARELLFIGAIVDGQGRNRSAELLEAYLPDLGLDGLETTAMGLPAIVEGREGAPLISVFAHLDCPYCAELHGRLAPAVASGKVRVRWLLGSGRTGERAQAAYTELGGTTDADLGSYFRGQAGAAAGEAGVEAVSRVDTEMRRQALGGTPFLVFRTRSGAVQTYAGLPDDGMLGQILATVESRESRRSETGQSQSLAKR